MSMTLNNQYSKMRHHTSASRSSSPARSTKSRGELSVTGSTGHLSKVRSPTYPAKGTTLGNVQLSPEEEQHLESVLSRFDEFKQKENVRIKRLENELVEKQKVRIRSAGASGDGHCYNCGTLFVAVFQPPVECYICRHEFCRRCLEKMPRMKKHICKFCLFESVQRGRLGVWFTEELKQARVAGRVRGVSGPEALRSSLLRIKRESRAISLMEQLDNQGASRANKNKWDESKTDYVPPRTELWVQQVKSPADNQRDNSMSRSSSNPSIRDPGNGGSLPKSSSMLSADYMSQMSEDPSMVSSHHKLLRPSDRPSETSSFYKPRPPVNERLSDASSNARIGGSMFELRQRKRAEQNKSRLTSEAWNKSLTSVSHVHGSTLSVASGRSSIHAQPVTITGDLRLDIQYDHQSSTLRVGVKQARDLAVVDKKHQTCNPYIKCYLLPDKTKSCKRKTTTKKRTRNPVFDEELKYHIPYSEMSERSLQVSVWHKPSAGARVFLGEIIIPFFELQLGAGAQWFPLSEKREAIPSTLQAYRGELLVAVKLVPGGTLDSQSELHVWIKSAKGLTTTPHDSKVQSLDSFVKVQILPNKTKYPKRKTEILKNSNSPEWNTNFVYKNVDRAELPQMALELTVCSHHRFSKEIVGYCRLNNGSKEQPWLDALANEQSIWLSMLGRPQTWFEGFIRLRPSHK